MVVSVVKERLDSLRVLITAYPDGMLPSHKCRQCGKVLNVDGGHPAELHLGTYTGLCYSCENGGPICIAQHASGAETWEFAPHCPAWRRSRERFIGFPGCPDCGGRGRIMVAQSDVQGGSFPRNCVCAQRHYQYTPRKIVLRGK